MAWIDSYTVKKLLSKEIGQSVMMLASRMSTIKTMKTVRERDRYDPITHYDVQELMDIMSSKLSHPKKALWKDNFDLISTTFNELLKKEKAMKKLYHYTGADNISSIKEKGLLNVFGLMFFTSSEEIEPTVNFEPIRQQGRVVVNLDDSYKKVSDALATDYDLLASYFNPELIGLVSDISTWYYSEKEKLTDEIVSYEIHENGEWITYE